MEAKKIVSSVAAALWLLAANVGCGYYQPVSASTNMLPPTARSQWQFGDIPGELLTTEHYRIYTTARNRGLLERLPGFMECAYVHYRRLTGLAPTGPAEPMPIYMLATRQQWVVMTEAVTRPHQDIFLSIENGGYCYQGKCVFWDLRHIATFSIAAHEGLHQFFHHQLRQHIPAWTEEGLCVLAEGLTIQGSAVRFHPQWNPSRILDLRRAIANGRWIGLQKLVSTDAADYISGKGQESPEYYGQLWALMLLIRSEPTYRAGLERMVADAAAGRLREQLDVPPIIGTGRAYARAIAVPAFKHYIEADLGGFEKRFGAYARTLAKLE